jgi:hypothetical protein
MQALDKQMRGFATDTAQRLTDAAAGGVRAELSPRVTRLDDETARLSRNQTEITRANGVVASRVEQVALQESSARDQQINALRAEQRAEIARVATGTLDIDARVDAIVARRVEERLAGIDTTIDKRVNARTAEVQAAITRTVRADISTISDRVTALDTRVQRIPTR